MYLQITSTPSGSLCPRLRSGRTLILLLQNSCVVQRSQPHCAVIMHNVGGGINASYPPVLSCPVPACLHMSYTVYSFHPACIQHSKAFLHLAYSISKVLCTQRRHPARYLLSHDSCHAGRSNTRDSCNAAVPRAETPPPLAVPRACLGFLYPL